MRESLPLRLAVAATALLLVPGTVLARDVPDNLRTFYDAVRDRGACRSPLASGFHSSDGDSGDFDYCGDHLDDYGVVYLQGPRGALANMDVDCDGLQKGPADDGRCKSSSDTQSVTSFQWDVDDYTAGQQKDLDANVHPYVVFGNEASRSSIRNGWPVLDPTDHGIKPLSIVAVVCGDKLVYGIWGDTNGDDGDEAMVGEASIALATACYGTSRINGNRGHDEDDVLYLAFTGRTAVPGADGAHWNATSHDEFQKSITALGDDLVKRIGGNSDWKDKERDSGARLLAPAGLVSLAGLAASFLLSIY